MVNKYFSDYNANKREFETTALSKDIYKASDPVKESLIQKIANIFHGLVGYITVPASRTFKATVTEKRKNIDLNGNYQYKRLTIEVEGYKIDTILMGTKETIQDEKRWVLLSNGNEQFAEDRANSHDFKQILKEFNSNGILFNYPGVGSSSGMPNRQAMAKAYCAVLDFLEKKVQATEIIGYGHSIGGGVQAEGLSKHTFNDNIKYGFIKSRTFSLISKVPSFIEGLVLKLFGWNINTLDCSKKLTKPEIILQTIDHKQDSDYKVLTTADKDSIIYDDIIPKKGSLAYALLNEGTDKKVIGIKTRHYDPLPDKTIKHLAEDMQTLMKS